MQMTGTKINQKRHNDSSNVNKTKLSHTLPANMKELKLQNTFSIYIIEFLICFLIWIGNIFVLKQTFYGQI